MQTNYQKEEIKEIMNNNGNKTTFLDFLKANKKKILLIILASFFFAFGSTSLLTKAATIQTGLSAISMTISLILPVTKPYLNFIYHISYIYKHFHIMLNNRFIIFSLKCYKFIFSI